MALEELFNNLPSDWDYITLGEACSRGGGGVQTGPFGSQLHAADYVAEGIPSIMPLNIGENRVIKDGIARITRKDAERLSRYLVRKGDIVYSRRGDVEKRALIRENEDGWLCGTGCLRVRFGENAAEPTYASYYLGHPAVREWIVRHAQGATMPNLNTSILSALPFVCPPLPEQRAIASILGSLDDKIELNRRMNETLESLAQTLFKSWFIDPTRNGLPKGWRETTIIEEFNITMGQSPPGESYNETRHGIPFYQGKTDFGFRYPTARVYCTAPTRFANSGDSLVSVRAPVGSVNMASEKCAIGRGVASVRHKSGSRSYTYYSMRSLEADFAAFEAEGTVFGSINKSDFHGIKRAAAPTEVVHSFEKAVFPIDQRIENNEKESRTLAALRDTLLPRLLSGELRVASQSSGA